MNRDEENLRLLAMFHYIVAGLTGLCAMIPCLHLALGLFFIYGAKHFKGHGAPPPAFLGWIFVILASVFIVLGLIMAVLIPMNGRCLAKRRHYTFCQVMGCVECLVMPFGTALGVFTLIVLTRESVRPMFGITPGVAEQPRP